MRKIAIGALVLTVMSSTAFADDLNYNIIVQKNKNGTTEVIHKSTVQAQVGKTTPFAVIETMSYIAEAKRTPDGKTEIAPGSVTTGFMASVTPKAIDPKSGAVDTEMVVDATKLNGLADVKSGDTTVQKPDVAVLVKSNGRVVLTPGQLPVVVAAGSDGIEVLASINR